MCTHASTDDPPAPGQTHASSPPDLPQAPPEASLSAIARPLCIRSAAASHLPSPAAAAAAFAPPPPTAVRPFVAVCPSAAVHSFAVVAVGMTPLGAAAAAASQAGALALLLLHVLRGWSLLPPAAAPVGCAKVVRVLS